MEKHPGPPLGVLATIFMVLFNLGLYFVISFSPEAAHFPGPWEPADVITTYFQGHSRDVLLCALFQFGAAVPLGLFTASVFSRLRFLGVKAAGASIALFGGFATAIGLLISSSILWVMAYPGIAQEAGVLRALYYLTFAIGGVGYSVPLGLLMAGIAVTTGMSRLLPKGIVIPGILIAIVGELSWISMIFPKALFLIPLTRFPAFLWLIAVGFMLPKKREADRPL